MIYQKIIDLFDFIQSIKNGMNCKLLAKNVTAWFNENQDAKKERLYI